MRNITWDEYIDRLSEVGAKWNADNGAEVSDRHPKLDWTCPLRSVTVSIRLANTRSRDSSMVPECVVGSSSGLTGDAFKAHRVARAAIETLDKATAALCELDGLVVWLRDCPCDSCSGRGYDRWKTPCKVCDGTGKRGGEG